VEPSEPAPAPVRDARAAPESSRLRAPGSDWLFLKLYCPRALAEELIVGPLRTIGEFASSAGLADAWFFVRYADPDPHLRVRFHGAPDALLGRLLPQLCSWARDLIADGLCPRFAFETYDREVERYGGEAGATVAETIFGADSPAVVELLALSRAHLPTIDRTTLAVVSIDDLLGGVGLSEDERLSWYRDRVSLSREDGREYRQRKAALRRLLGRSDPLADEPGGYLLAQVLASRRRALAPAAARLKALAGDGALEQPTERLCHSYVHLHCNRLLGAGSALEERVLQLLRRTREGLSQAPLR
jgi:thiopeptide-type bacteriocin biosynthesis protein